MKIIKKALWWIFFPVFMFAAGVVMIGVMLLEKDFEKESMIIDGID